MLAEEVRTLRQMVGELEAYCVELEEQIHALESQLDAANKMLGEREGQHSSRAHEDSRRLQMLLEEHDAALNDAAELQRRVSALAEANDGLTATNAGLTEQQPRFGAATISASVEGMTLDVAIKRPYQRPDLMWLGFGGLMLLTAVVFMIYNRFALPRHAADSLTES